MHFDKINIIEHNEEQKIKEIFINKYNIDIIDFHYNNNGKHESFNFKFINNEDEKIIKEIKGRI